MSVLFSICLYILFVLVMVQSFLTNVFIGFLLSVTYFFLARTFLLNTFIPIAMNWFSKVINNDIQLQKIKDGEYGSYISYLGSIYVNYQDKDSDVHRSVKSASYLSFLVLPILIIVALKLINQSKKL